MKSIIHDSRLFILAITLALALNACAPITTSITITPTSEPTQQPAPVRQSQTAPDYNPSIRFEHIGLEQGLSQSVANVILQDQKGFLWIGTEDGLNRFDGYNFKVYRPEADNPNTVSDRWITSLLEDQNGFLWVGTRQGGLSRFDPHSGLFTTYKHDLNNPASLSDNYVLSLYLDKDHYIWVGTENGLDQYDPATDSFKQYTIDDNAITVIYQDAHNVLWVGTKDSGLIKFDRANGTFNAYKYSLDDPNSLSNNHVNAITEDLTGDLWIGTGNGLVRYDQTTGVFTRYYHSAKTNDSLGNNFITQLFLDQDGALWVGTNDGLDLYTAHSNRFFHYRNEPINIASLSNNTIRSIYEDRGGVLWIGTYGGGLNKYNRQQDQFTYYRNVPDNPNSLSGNIIFPIYVDPSGIVWIGTYGNGLNRFNPVIGKFTQYHSNPDDPNSLSSDQIFSIFMDYKGILWVGTSRALDRFDPRTNQFSHYRLGTENENGLSGLPVYTIYQDKTGNMWLGTGKGLDQFNPQSGIFINYKPRNPSSISGEQVTAILEDSHANLWIGTFGNGLNRFDRREEKFIQYQNIAGNTTSLSNNSVLCIYEDHHGSLWIATAGGGLNLYHPETGTFTAFTEKDGLPNNVIFGILEDESGKLWLSTNYGISRFDPQTKTFLNFTASDGLQSNEFNSTAYAVSPSGEMYFGGINGMNSFKPLEITSNNYIPPVVLTALMQDGHPMLTEQQVETLQEITLSWPQNSFEFEFAALSFSQPSKNKYTYMLKGFDSTWNEIGTKHNGRYTNLPGGKYTLLLRGGNSDGIWNESPLSIQVTVVPPFWQTMWFRILLALLLAAAIAGGYRLRLNSIQNRNRELEKVVQQRTGELKKRNVEMEALYQADEKILRTVSLNQVFQTLVAVAVESLNADRSVVLAWNEDQSRIIPRVSHGFAPETLETLKFSKGEGLIGKVLTTGKPLIVTDLKPEDLRPDIRAAILAEGIHSFVHLPIIVDDRIIGIFNVGFTRPNAINEDNVRLFTALVQRAALSIANMQLFEQTKDLAVMEARNRLARDLHDSAKQKAFAALAQLGTVRGVLKNKGEAPNLHLSEAENLVYEVIQELTFLIQEIYPIALQEKGLIMTLREYIFEWETHNDIIVNLIARDERRLQLEIEQAIYRAIQEAFANVARHSKAKHVEISLVYTPDALQVTFLDDGCGFDMDLKGHGMGLRSIRERISSIHGTAQIQSEPGQGTKILIHVPIKSKAGGADDSSSS